MDTKPLAIDLFSGLGGWTSGLLAEGYEVIGFDIERHVYGDEKYPAQLVLQDVLTLHGSQFKDASLIVASPPCQEYSYMAMPWSRAKQIAVEYRSGERDVRKLTALFDACFRIQREACEAAGRYIPMVVENVKGAQPWVGRARWHYGSFYLWGDVPALMPVVQCAQKFNPDGSLHGTGSWFAIADSKIRGARSLAHGENVGDRNTHRPSGGTLHSAYTGSKSKARKAASATIAKIPLVLARHIAQVYYPRGTKSEQRCA
jgi:C-5 cytosine-specific DNA methylase